MALNIDWTEYGNLTPREQYDAAGELIDEVKALVAARRCRIAHDLALEHGAIEAASVLGISDKRVYQLAARYRESQPVVASRIPGRSIHSYDLLDEVMEATRLGKQEAHDAIHALLDQMVDEDGEDAVILHRQAIRPELLKSNPQDLDVYYWLTVRQESADMIRESLTAEHVARVA